MPRKKSKSPSKKSVSKKSGRRIFPKEFKEEAVQMLLDGHTASSGAKRLGLSHANVLYRWKSEQLAQERPSRQCFGSPSTRARKPFQPVKVKTGCDRSSKKAA